jgi:hypothetical protein
MKTHPASALHESEPSAPVASLAHAPDPPAAPAPDTEQKGLGRTSRYHHLMVSRISHTTFDCHDAFSLSTFWKQVLGYQDVPGDPNEPGHEECMIIGPGDEPRLLFVEVPEDKQVKNRVHLDLEPTEGARDDEIERVVALGAIPLDDLRKEDGSGWLVLADPEGNEFCILRSRTEREQD